VNERFCGVREYFPVRRIDLPLEDKIESGNETLVFFKLSEDRQLAFQDKLRSLHPYDVPEIIFVSIAGGLTDYLQWVSENCR